LGLEMPNLVLVSVTARDVLARLAGRRIFCGLASCFEHDALAPIANTTLPSANPMKARESMARSVAAILAPHNLVCGDA
jgi:hypothetical protein